MESRKENQREKRKPVTYEPSFPAWRLEQILKNKKKSKKTKKFTSSPTEKKWEVINIDEELEKRSKNKKRATAEANCKIKNWEIIKVDEKGNQKTESYGVPLSNANNDTQYGPSSSAFYKDQNQSQEIRYQIKNGEITFSEEKDPDFSWFNFLNSP